MHSRVLVLAVQLATAGMVGLTGCGRNSGDSTSPAASSADSLPDRTRSAALSAKEEGVRQRELQLARAEHELKKWADRLHERETASKAGPLEEPPSPARSALPAWSPPGSQAEPRSITPLVQKPPTPTLTEETVATPPDEPQQSADGNLRPKKRPRRQIRATTASYGGPAKLFGDKLMMRVMQNPQRIPQGKFYECNFDAFLDVRTLKPGEQFGIAVDGRGQANFGPAQEAGGLSEEQWFEAQVLAVRQPAPDKPTDRGGVVFQVKYLVMPHPNGDPNLEMAIPVKAVVVSEKRDDRPDFRSREQDSERVWSAVGQMTGGVEGYFNAGAASVLLSKLNNIYIGKDQSTQCYFFGQIKRQTPCYVRIDEDAVF